MERKYKIQIRPSIDIDALQVLESFKDEDVKDKATIGDVIYQLLCESPRFKERLDEYKYYWNNKGKL